MSLAFLIRDADIKDAPIITAAQKEIAKTPGLLAPKPHEIEEQNITSKIKSLSESSNGKFVVIQVEDVIIGHAYLERLKLEVISHVVDLTIAIHIGHQGQGFGKAILKHLIEWARNQVEIEKIMLHVRSSNKNAIHLYQNLGFSIEGVRTKFIKIESGNYLDNIAMALWVGPE